MICILTSNDEVCYNIHERVIRMNKKNSYNSAYTTEHYEKFSMRLKKGEKDILLGVAESKGVSLSVLVADAINSAAGQQIVRKVGEE